MGHYLSKHTRKCPFCRAESVKHFSAVCSRYYVSCDNESCPVKPRTKDYYDSAHAIIAWNGKT